MSDLFALWLIGAMATTIFLMGPDDTFKVRRVDGRAVTDLQLGVLIVVTILLWPAAIPAWIALLVFHEHRD